jgi:hypothetical protein
LLERGKLLERQITFDPKDLKGKCVVELCESDMVVSQLVRRREGLQTLGDGARDSLRGYPLELTTRQ